MFRSLTYILRAMKNIDEISPAPSQACSNETKQLGRPSKGKGPLRNFYFVKSADSELVRRAQENHQTMTVVLENLLLDQRQPSTATDQLADMVAKMLSIPRERFIETAVLDLIKRKLEIAFKS
jgi:hypothetical protein